MVPFTRRRLLQCAVVLLGGVAGCNGTDDDASTGTPTVPARRSDDRVVPEHVTLRNPESEPPVWFPPEGDETTDAATDDRPPRRARARGFVADAETVEDLRFADVEEVDEARSFLAATEFDSETVYVETRSVRACYTLALCHVSWTDTSIDTAYGSVYRDVDVRCETDDRDGVSVLIRLPEVLDPDAVTSYGGSWSSNGCHRRRPPAAGTTTEPPQYGPKTPTNRTATEETATEARTTNGAASNWPAEGR